MKPEQLIQHAYSYRRVSRSAQALGAGLSRQDDSALAICKAMGWELQPENLVDLGYSGWSAENLTREDAALKKFIDAAKSGKLKPNSVLLIDDFSRFSRQELRKAEKVFLDLLEIGVAIHNSYTRRTYTAESANDKLQRIEIILGFDMAYEYSANISRKVNDSFQRKYALAGEGKAVQLGYWQPTWIDFHGPKKGVGKFVPNPRNWEIVRGIVDDYLAGGSMMKICNRLNQSKTPCLGRGKKQGRRWSQGTVRYILTSETLLGTITITEQGMPKGDESDADFQKRLAEWKAKHVHTFKNYYPAIVTEKEWTKIQSRIADNRTKKSGSREGEAIVNLFPGRVQCACCGGHVSTGQAVVMKDYGYTRKDGKFIRHYFKCLDSRLKGDKKDVKHRQMFPIDVIEQDFFMMFLKKNPVELIGNDASEQQEKIAAVDLQLSKVNKDITDATGMIGVLKIEDLQRTLTALAKRRTELEQTRQELGRTLIAQTNAPDAIINIREALLGKVVYSGKPKTDIFGATHIHFAKADTAKMDAARKQIASALLNQETRKKMVQILPSLIDHVTVDFAKKSFSFTTKEGKTTREFSGE